MKRAPVRRWLAFWLGLPGFVFLLWLWVDSTRCGRSVRYLNHSRIDRLEQKDSGIELALYRYLKPGVDHGGPQFQFFAEPRNPAVKTALFPSPGLTCVRNGLLDLRIWTTPHWLLAGGYLALWMGWLFRRGRKIVPPEPRAG